MPKKSRKKYERKSPTPTQKILMLDNANQELQQKIKAQDEMLSMVNKQCGNLSSLVDRQYEEIAMLIERNLTLIEAVEILARSSRMEKQQSDLNKFNRSRNDTVSLTDQCEAGYAHGYEKRR